jgi:predicted ATPase
LIGGEEDTTLLSGSTDPRSHQIVGRDAPLEMLDRITQRMLTGQRQIAFVTGEPGIGKTAFIEKAVDRLSRPGVDLLCGGCTARV